MDEPILLRGGKVRRPEALAQEFGAIDDKLIQLSKKGKDFSAKEIQKFMIEGFPDEFELTRERTVASKKRQAREKAQKRRRKMQTSITTQVMPLAQYRPILLLENDDVIVAVERQLREMTVLESSVSDSETIEPVEPIEPTGGTTTATMDVRVRNRVGEMMVDLALQRRVAYVWWTDYSSTSQRPFFVLNAEFIVKAMFKFISWADLPAKLRGRSSKSEECLRTKELLLQDPTLDLIDATFWYIHTISFERAASTMSNLYRSTLMDELNHGRRESRTTILDSSSLPGNSFVFQPSEETLRSLRTTKTPIDERQSVLLARMSRAMSALFSRMEGPYRDSFFSVFSYLVGYAVLVSFYHSFPASREVFSTVFLNDVYKSVGVLLQGYEPSFQTIEEQRIQYFKSSELNCFLSSSPSRVHSKVITSAATEDGGGKQGDSTQLPGIGQPRGEHAIERDAAKQAKQEHRFHFAISSPAIRKQYEPSASGHRRSATALSEQRGQHPSQFISLMAVKIAARKLREQLKEAADSSPLSPMRRTQSFGTFLVQTPETSVVEPSPVGRSKSQPRIGGDVPSELVGDGRSPLATTHSVGTSKTSLHGSRSKRARRKKRKKKGIIIQRPIFPTTPMDSDRPLAGPSIVSHGSMSQSQLAHKRKKLKAERFNMHSNSPLIQAALRATQEESSDGRSHTSLGFTSTRQTSAGKRPKHVMFESDSSFPKTPDHDVSDDLPVEEGRSVFEGRLVHSSLGFADKTPSTWSQKRDFQRLVFGPSAEGTYIGHVTPVDSLKARARVSPYCSDTMLSKAGGVRFVSEEMDSVMRELDNIEEFEYQGNLKAEIAYFRGIAMLRKEGPLKQSEYVRRLLAKSREAATKGRGSDVATKRDELERRVDNILKKEKMRRAKEEAKKRQREAFIRGQTLQYRRASEAILNPHKAEKRESLLPTLPVSRDRRTSLVMGMSLKVRNPSLASRKDSLTVQPPTTPGTTFGPSMEIPHPSFAMGLGRRFSASFSSFDEKRGSSLAPIMDVGEDELSSGSREESSDPLTGLARSANPRFIPPDRQPQHLELDIPIGDIGSSDEEPFDMAWASSERGFRAMLRGDEPDLDPITDEEVDWGTDYTTQ